MRILKIVNDPKDKNSSDHFIRYDLNDINKSAEVEAAIQIAQALYTIYQLFNKPEDPLDKIGDWIIDLAEQLKEFGQDLKDIKRKLEELQVYIDEIQIREAEVSLLSAIDTYKQHVFDLRENPNDINILNTFRDLYFQQISIASNNLKRWSYATVMTLGYALKVELELMTALKLSTSSRNEVLKDYITYFNTCLNENKLGTIAYALKATTNTIDELNRRYFDGDMRSEFFYFISRTYTEWWDRPREGARPVTVYEVSKIFIDYKISGTLEQQNIQGTLTPQNIQKIGDEYRDPGYPRSKERAIEKAKEHFEQTVLADYNEKMEIFKTLDANRKALENAKQGCEQFISICNSRLQ